MHVLAQPFWLHKIGNAPEEYEDALWPEQLTDTEGKLFRFAVADGATETSFSGMWADILVRAYGQGQLNARNLLKSLPSLQKEWLNTRTCDSRWEKIWPMESCRHRR
jgi:hypothetical protein